MLASWQMLCLPKVHSTYLNFCGALLQGRVQAEEDVDNTSKAKASCILLLCLWCCHLQDVFRIAFALSKITICLTSVYSRFRCRGLLFH
jgi:hypothetical protein